jgi:hypothetical protein
MTDTDAEYTSIDSFRDALRDAQSDLKLKTTEDLRDLLEISAELLSMAIYDGAMFAGVNLKDDDYVARCRSVDLAIASAQAYVLALREINHPESDEERAKWIERVRYLNQLVDPWCDPHPD